MTGFYTIAEVCAFFKVSRTTVGRWEDEQGFPRGVRLSNHPRGRCGFPRDEVEAWSEGRCRAREQTPTRSIPSE